MTAMDVLDMLSAVHNERLRRIGPRLSWLLQRLSRSEGSVGPQT
jgi:hypothetical protein